MPKFKFKVGDSVLASDGSITTITFQDNSYNENRYACDNGEVYWEHQLEKV